MLLLVLIALLASLGSLCLLLFPVLNHFGFDGPHSFINLDSIELIFEPVKPRCLCLFCFTLVYEELSRNHEVDGRRLFRQSFHFLFLLHLRVFGCVITQSWALDIVMRTLLLALFDHHLRIFNDWVTAP